MRLDVVLPRIGASIVKSEVAPTQDKVTLFLRAGTSQSQTAQWKKTLEELLAAEMDEQAKKRRWSVDLSRAYFMTPNKAVKYLWRIILKGDVRTGAEAFGQAVLRSLTSGGADVMSMPLVGQAQYEFDPENGKMKGGHSPSKARAAITKGMSGGSVQ